MKNGKRRMCAMDVNFFNGLEDAADALKEATRLEKPVDALDNIQKALDSMREAVELLKGVGK